MKEKLKSLVRPVYRFFKSNGIKRDIKGTNNRIELNDIAGRIDITINGSNNSISIGSGSVIRQLRIYIRGNNHRIVIGNNCYIAEGVLWLDHDACSIVIEERTTIESATLAAVEPGRTIRLGKGCMLATDIEIRTSDSHSILDTQTGERINPAKDVIISDHVWIGARCTLLKGTAIGSNAVIGTGAVVSGSVPGNVVAAGIPARVIREHVTWAEELHPVEAHGNTAKH